MERSVNGMDEKRYYMAYGSNLSLDQMAVRCPDAKAVGTAILSGWRLLFKGCATVEPCEGRDTPVLVWEISERDERSLDRYEGFPGLYYKKELETGVFPLGGGEPVKRTAMVYIMDEKRRCAAPSLYYYRILEEGYRNFHFPMCVLTQALKDSVGAAEARRFLGTGDFC